jgi:predicted HicB family RNase H-like nuclease
MSLTEQCRVAWRLLRQATGEAKWDDYLAACRRDGVEPMSRREFERHRSEVREHNPQSRCC